MYLDFLTEFWKLQSEIAKPNLVSKLLDVYKHLNSENKTKLISALIAAISRRKIDFEQTESVIVALKLFKEEMKDRLVTDTYVDVSNFLAT